MRARSRERRNSWSGGGGMFLRRGEMCKGARSGGEGRRWSASGGVGAASDGVAGNCGKSRNVVVVWWWCGGWTGGWFPLLFKTNTTLSLGDFQSIPIIFLCSFHSIYHLRTKRHLSHLFIFIEKLFPLAGNNTTFHRSSINGTAFRLFQNGTIFDTY